MKLLSLLLLLTVLLFTNCNKEERELLENAENVLPGKWNISQFELGPGNSSEIRYERRLIPNDTILQDIGSISIDEFSIDSLGLDDGGIRSAQILCELSIGQEQFSYSMKSLFISGEELFARFESNRIGIDTINTVGEEFLSSSNIFFDNYYIFILDNNNVELQESNGISRHSIKLTRM